MEIPTSCREAILYRMCSDGCFLFLLFFFSGLKGMCHVFAYTSIDLVQRLYEG